MATHFPHGLSTFDAEGIFGKLPSTFDPLTLFEDFQDFTIELDFPGGFSTWDTYGTGTVSYPGQPFGVIQLNPSADDTFGIQQDICQAVDFTLGSDLWARFRFACPQANSHMWAGMASAAPFNNLDPPPDYLDEWAEACLFHVLPSDEITLEVWENSFLVQTIENIGTMPRDGTRIELAYHYDGERIEIAIDGVRVAAAAMPIVPTITLHGLMGMRDASASGTDDGPFDYYYSAQIRGGE